jgi:hypothetical protein
VHPEQNFSLFGPKILQSAAQLAAQILSKEFIYFTAVGIRISIFPLPTSHKLVYHNKIHSPHCCLHSLVVLCCHPLPSTTAASRHCVQELPSTTPIAYPLRCPSPPSSSAAVVDRCQHLYPLPAALIHRQHCCCLQLSSTTIKM